MGLILQLVSMFTCLYSVCSFLNLPVFFPGVPSSDLDISYLVDEC